jgi:APA family basic amino acid/polyamine antiporter
LTISVILLIYKPNYTLPGLGLVLLGIPVFFLWNRKKNVESFGEETDESAI